MEKNLSFDDDAKETITVDYPAVVVAEVLKNTSINNNLFHEKVCYPSIEIQDQNTGEWIPYENKIRLRLKVKKD